MDAGIVAAGNAIGFVLMEVWFPSWWRNRSYEKRVPTRRMAAMRAGATHAAGSARGCCETLANSRLLRACMEPLRVCEFQSDIRDVVYVNYLVDA